MKHFEDMGIVAARSDWSGKESMVVFKCGPFLGHKAVDLNHQGPFCDWGGGHVHQDANHFILYGAGEFLLRDDGYVCKTTETHNTLLVNGKGQTGGDQMWFHGDDLLRRHAKPSIKWAVSHPQYDYMAGDAKEAYDPGLGLLRYDRHLLFVKPNVLLVIDDIEAAEDCELELRFFPEAQLLVSLDEGKLAVGKHSLLFMNPLHDEKVEDRFEKIEVPVNIAGDTQERLVLRRICRQGGRWQSAVAFSWNEAPSCPVYVQTKQSGRRFEFIAGAQAVSLNLDTREVCLGEAGREADTPGGQAKLAALIINHHELEDFAPERQEYFYDTSRGVQIVRKPFNQLKVWAIPQSLAAVVEEHRPEGGFGRYQWTVTAPDGSGCREYTLTVAGSDAAAVPLEILSVAAGGTPAASVPEAVLDNDPNTYWAAEGDGPFLQLDLGAERRIKGVDIGWLKGDIRQACFDIEVSLDGIGFDCILAGKQSSGTTTWPEFYPVGEIAARYVRIVCHGNTLNKWNSITQVGVYA
ncbi:Heparinase II/III-like protein [compost metagenome]